MRRGKVVAIAMAIVVGIFAGSAIRAESDKVSDWKLKYLVKLQLLDKLGVDGLRIEVDANDGVVHLGGVVKKRETAELSETIAKSVDGVRRVEEDVHVDDTAKAGATTADKVGKKVGGAVAETGHELADGLLDVKVHLALLDKMGSDGFRIGTESANGVVTLQIPKDLESSRREEAVRLTRKVAGVKRVVTIDKH